MTLDYFYGQSGELFSYFRIPKALFQDCRFRQLSTDARTLYGILLDRMSLSAKNGWLDEQGRVYIIYTVREVQESLCCGEHKAVKLFRELEDIDLIERKRRGLGRPSLIYVKDFSSGLPKAQVQNCTNSNSGAAESAILEQPKLQANKTDKNKTEWNDPDPIHSGNIREQLEDYFYQVLEVDLLLRLCPDDDDTIYQIVDLLVDTCSTKRKMLRIAGDDKPTEVVRSRLKKLNADHIRFVLDSLAENTAPVRNMKQYLLAMLYNAPTTMNLYYQNKTNVYDEIRNVLLAKGVPESEIAFVHDATSEAQRQELFERTRQGKVRILIGSTSKLGTGVNVQNKVISIDHLDCPWKPSDITQRNGRGVRQGNENPEIMIKQFVAKGTFDAYLWQIQEQKLRYITQILTGKHIARSCEDVDETVLSAAQFKAAATDNPMVAQKMELENRVTELKILRGAWSNEQLSLERKISTIYPGQIKRYEKEIDQIGEDIKLLNQSAGSDFSIVLDGKRYTERSEAGEAFGLLYRMIKEGAKDDSEEFEIGAYRSFPLYLSVGYVSRLVLRYNHHYTTEVGTSALGAITRIEHLAERIPGYLKEAQRELEEVQKQLAVSLRSMAVLKKSKS